MKRARDVRDQLEGLMDRVEIEVKSNLGDTAAIRKVIAFMLAVVSVPTFFLVGYYGRIFLPRVEIEQERTIPDGEEQEHGLYSSQ